MRAVIAASSNGSGRSSGAACSSSASVFPSTACTKRRDASSTISGVSSVATSTVRFSMTPLLSTATTMAIWLVVSLVRDVLDRGMRVAIGNETGVEPLADCSLVVAPFAVDGVSAGTIGVLGPTRMDYSQALSAVAVVSKRLERELNEG
ncbi:MAG: hypothetical protein EBZ17_09285 [Actinobacteria bacterium]|nr:hypothetical protein [Actinomycetota bacterium]